MVKIKELINRLPIINSITRVMYKYLSTVVFTNPEKYWDMRYSRGGNSGMGSYGKLAEFKAEFINEFVKMNNISSIIEFGCGDGNQLSLAEYPAYIGLDISKNAIAECALKFQGDNTKSFFLYDPAFFFDNHSLFSCDLALSLDVIFHLVDDRTFQMYMHHLFKSAKHYVIVYSSNSEEIQPAAHIRNRCFTQWVDENIHEWFLIDKVMNKYPYSTTNKTGSWSDFYVYANRKSSSKS